MVRVFTTDGNERTGVTGTCTVRVNATDPTCAFLDDKLVVGTGISKSIVPGASGYALQLDVDNDAVLSGIDSDEMNFVVCDATEVTQVDGGESGTDFHWVMTNHYGTDLSTHHTAILHTINYVDEQGTWDVRYHCDSTKILDSNIDTTKDMTLRYGFSLVTPEGSSEAAVSIDMVYIDTDDEVVFLNVVDEYLIASTTAVEVHSHSFDIDRPVDIKPNTSMGFFVNIFDAPLTSEQVALGVTRATSIKMSSGTIYQRVDHYPLEEGDIV